MKHFLTIAALAAAATVPAHATEFVVNGSFEDNLQANGSWAIYSNLGGWTGGASGIELRNNVAGQAFDQKNYVELDTTGNSSIQQVIGTHRGAHYQLSFAYSARPGTAGMPADTNDIQVFWNGSLLATLSAVNPSNASHAWQVYNFDVVGGNSSVLKFQASGRSDSYGGSLDAVSLVSVVPEPQTLVLLLAGLGAMGFFKRRRAA